ncbi:hypothetical protein TrVE_jg9892 [Triparma verrucosa]|uniref:NnrU domain-containing protein n=1 Tax=Triparma verrucosa TaxID=1606542 RepID=A0A9W6Z699_9STRA|nr:hypothetical protein TrVE_jg9892 [Triparma verrucosa]
MAAQTVNVGDDAAKFQLSEQSIEEWIKFTVATSLVLAVVSYLWFLPSGPELGTQYLDTLQSSLGTTDPSITIFAQLTIFAVVHSGLAALRPYNPLGERFHRVIFALSSLPLSLSAISYFVNHSHENPLWTFPSTPLTHSFLFLTNLISFLLLYPSTFNLLEIAAITPPKLHLYQTGVIRITRHPQAIGQILWCLAHTLYLGSGVSVSASAALIGHHMFSIWHGDKRLSDKHGENFETIKSQTSVVPFQAVWERRQVLPDDYWREWCRLPYFFVVGGTVGAYFAHPYMMAGAAMLHW